MGLKDGVFDCSGLRKVRKGGQIKFNHFWYQHERLAGDWVGAFVWCENTDIWASDYILVFDYVKKEWICNADRES